MPELSNIHSINWTFKGTDLAALRCANVRTVREKSLNSTIVISDHISPTLWRISPFTGGFCDPKSGGCSCLAGWRGALCDDPCPPGTHGANCTSSCQVEILTNMPMVRVMIELIMVEILINMSLVMVVLLQCQNQGNCHPVTGNCHCPMGWTVSLSQILLSCTCVTFS